MKKSKRRNFFIKKDFQGKLILGYFLFVTAGCLFFIVVLTLFSTDTLSISYTNHDLQLEQTTILLIQKVITSHWVFIIFGTITLVLAAMLLTHRIAGPMYRFEKTLDNMLKRKLDKTIYLRSKDEGKELARKINAFNIDLSQTIKNLQYHSDALGSLLKQAKVKSSDISPQLKEEINRSVLEYGRKKQKDQSNLFIIYPEG